MQRPAAFSIDSTDERDSDMKSKTSTPRAINASINKNDGLSNSSSNSDPIASTTDQQEASQGKFTTQIDRRGSAPSTAQLLMQQSRFQFLVELVTLKRRNLQEFRILLALTILLNIFAIIAEIVEISYRTDDSLPLPSAYGILSLIAIIMAFINASLIFKGIIRPSTRAPLVSCLLIVVLEIIYVAQIIIFYTTSDSNTLVFSLNVIFIVIQLLTSIILYRYWEYVYFSYDDEKSISSRSDMGSLRSSLYDVESPIQR